MCVIVLDKIVLDMLYVYVITSMQNQKAASANLFMRNITVVCDAPSQALVFL